MKPNISFDEMAAVIDARIELLRSSHLLWRARITGSSRRTLIHFERYVTEALDRLWEVQQRAA